MKYLHCSNVHPSSCLEYILVFPFRMRPPDPASQDVVPAVEEDAQSQEGGVLVRPWIAKN